MVRKYKEKNRARKHSKLSEELFGKVILGFTMGLNPTEIASALPISVQSIRSLFKDFRAHLGEGESHFYFAAFYLLDVHWPEHANFGTLKTLQKIGTGFRFQQHEIGQTYDCIFSCPASLSPKQLKKSIEAEGSIESPSIVNPNPRASLKNVESHDRYSCTSCPNVWLRERVAAKFLDKVSIELAYYRSIKKEEFGPYFLAASLSVMLNRMYEVQLEISLEKNMDVPPAQAEAQQHYDHVVRAISKLAFEILCGRQLIWRDLKDEERPGLEGLL